MKHLFHRYLHSHEPAAQFFRFAVVGMKVSIIDISGVYILPWLFGMNIYIARIISLGSAIFVGYILNRYFTFGQQHRGGFYKQMAGHFGIHLNGAALNFAVFTGVMILSQRYLQKPAIMPFVPLFAVWCGGVVGLVFNFMASRRFVFSIQNNVVKTS